MIQGSSAVLSILKGSGFVPYLCAESIQIKFITGIMGRRTVGDGVWKKKAYKDLDYNITLSGLLKFDDVNFSGWDFVQNQQGFSEVTFICSFTDDDGNTKSIQGNCIVKETDFTIAVSQLVSNDITLEGDGAPMIFDGTIPCPGALNTVTITGTTSASGNVNFAYTYSGPIAQIMYQIDGAGAWVTVSVGSSFNIPVLNFTIGNHQINMIPVCVNGYQGASVITQFTITLSLVCTAAVTSITSVNVSGNSVTFQCNLNTSPSNLSFLYRLNGGAWQIYSGPRTSGSSLIVMTLNNLAPGNYALDIQPVCSNSVPGTFGSTTFTIGTTTTFATINYSFSLPSAHGDFVIIVNGVQKVFVTATGTTSGTLIVNSTDSVYIAARPYANSSPYSSTNFIEDTTTTSTLYNSTLVGVGNGFTFVPGNADTYSATLSIT